MKAAAERMYEKNEGQEGGEFDPRTSKLRDQGAILHECTFETSSSFHEIHRRRL
jgi:hypothetical protein